MKIPCEECLCYVMCKRRLVGSVTALAWREKCDQLKRFINMSDQDNINEARILFNLKPYK